MTPLSELLQLWQERQLITPQEAATLETQERNRPVSLHLMLRTMLYTGILLFTSGIGILIYKNIDTLGHELLIVLLALLTLACFGYVFYHRMPFSREEIHSEGKLTDFVLLLACTLFLSLEGYVQWRYNLFGTRYGLAALLPAVLFLFCAYRFDHRGVLSMGLTALASWVGLTITPLEVMTSNDFNNQPLINTAVVFGLLVVGGGILLEKQNIKKHFTFTYLLLGGNLLFISALSGLFSSELWFVFALVVGGAAWYFFRYAQQTQSFLFLLMAVVYAYIGFTYLVFKWANTELIIALSSFYFIGSAVGVILFILNYKKLLKQ
ncbi:MAG: DUF2157 domain-containing protein [Spirosomataceae bacterium]